MTVTIEGRALKYGDNVDTDVIYPGKFMVYTKPEDVAKYALTGLDPEFPAKIKDYGLVVAGRNFGCGSSREHAPLSLKYAGTRCVMAESFARIFYRNSINIGLPLVECKRIHSKVYEGDVLQINLDKGTVINNSKGETYQAKPFPEFLLRILRHGGLIEYLNASLK